MAPSKQYYVYWHGNLTWVNSETRARAVVYANIPFRLITSTEQSNLAITTQIPTTTTKRGINWNVLPLRLAKTCES